MKLLSSTVQRLLVGLLLIPPFLSGCKEPRAREGKEASAVQIPPSSEQATRQSMLHQLLSETDRRRFAELLVRHGAVTGDEISQLVTETAAASAATRKNAARLLTLARDPAAGLALRQVLSKTDDVDVFALALGSLLDRIEGQSDGKGIATMRPELVQKALRSEDAEVAGAGLRAAWLAGLSAANQELGRKLDSPDARQRETALAILAKSGPGPFQPKLSALLLSSETSALSSAEPIYEALFRSSDLTTADTIRRSIAEGFERRETDFSNALFLSGSRKPWLRTLLLELARSEGPARGTALERLGEWGDAAPQRELVSICLKEYERRLPKNRPAGRNTDPELDPCDRYLGTLANRKFLLDDRPAAMEFARDWLAWHPEAQPL